MKLSPLFSIFLIILVDVMGLTIILPLLPFYAEKMGATPVVVGFLISSYAFCQLIAGPVLGQISDRIGRKPLLIVSQAGTFVGFLILAFANNLFWVFFSRIIDGITAGNLSVAQAYIVDVTEPKNRTRAFGLVGVAFGLGFLLGPTIKGFLSPFGYRYPIGAAACLSATSIIATFVLLPSKPAYQVSDKIKSSVVMPWKILSDSFKQPELALKLCQFFTFIFSFALLVSGFPLFAERRFTYQSHALGAKEVGYIFAYVGCVGIFIQAFWMGRLVQRFGEETLVKTGFLLMTLGFFALAWINTIPYLLLAITFSFVGSSVLRPSLTSLITQKVGRDEQGKVLGLTQSLMSISQFIAPILSGLLIQQRLLSFWALSGALFSGLGFFFFGKASKSK